jgi:hypothetical protein
MVKKDSCGVCLAPRARATRRAEDRVRWVLFPSGFARPVHGSRTTQAGHPGMLYYRRAVPETRCDGWTRVPTAHEEPARPECEGGIR